MTNFGPNPMREAPGNQPTGIEIPPSSPPLNLPQTFQSSHCGLISFARTECHIIVLERSFCVTFSFGEISEPIVRLRPVGATGHSSFEIGTRFKPSVSLSGEIRQMHQVIE